MYTWITYCLDLAIFEPYLKSTMLYTVSWDLCFLFNIIYPRFVHGFWYRYHFIFITIYYYVKNTTGNPFSY